MRVDTLLSPSARSILRYMQEQDDAVYGYKIIHVLGISNACTHKALRALERLGLAESWEGESGGRRGRPRRYYELTHYGRRKAIR